LPLLMMFMGLIIVFGYASVWKIRSEVVARDVGWKIRHPRDGSYTHNSNVDLQGSRVFELHERSYEWPEARDGNEILESRVNGDQRIQNFSNQEILQAPIIRGPVPEIVVDTNLLDFSRGVRRGNAEIDRPSPIMSEMGRVNYDTPNSFIDDDFKYMRMGIGNFSRRIPRIWETDLDFVYDEESIRSLIFEINGMRDPLVMAIDEDMDFYTWMTRLHFWVRNENDNWERRFLMGNPIPLPPNPRSYRFIFDFSASRSAAARNSPPFRSSSYRDGREAVRQDIETNYLRIIDEKPIRMAEETQRLFQRIIRANDNEFDPLDPDAVPRGEYCFPALSQGEVSFLEGAIEDLGRYIERLREARE